MSFDPNQPGTPYQQPYMEPKKSNAKWWIFGGIGCVVLLLLCGGGIAGLGYFGYNMVLNNDGFKDAKATVENSEQVKSILGEPITFGAPTDMKTNQKGGGSLEILYTVPVSGPDGSGIMKCKCLMDTQQNWTAEDIEVEIDGEVIELDSIDNMELDIDLGD